MDGHYSLKYFSPIRIHELIGYMVEIKVETKANIYFFRLVKAILLVFCLLLEQFVLLPDAFALTAEERRERRRETREERVAREAREAACREEHARRSPELRNCLRNARSGGSESRSSSSTPTPPPRLDDAQKAALCQSLESGMAGLQRQQLAINHATSGKSYDQLMQEYNSLAAQFNLIESMRDIRADMLTALATLTRTSSPLTNIETLEGNPGEVELGAMGDFLAMEVTLKSLLNPEDQDTLLAQLTAEGTTSQQVFTRMIAGCARAAADGTREVIDQDGITSDNNFCGYIAGKAANSPEMTRASTLFSRFFDTYRLAHQVESRTATDPRERERQKANLTELYQTLTQELDGTSIRDVFGVYGQYQQLTSRTQEGLSSYQGCMDRLNPPADTTAEGPALTAYREALTRCESCWTTNRVLCNPPPTGGGTEATESSLGLTLQNYASEFKRDSRALVGSSPLLRRAILLNDADSTLGTADVGPYMTRLENNIQGRIDRAKESINSRAGLLDRNTTLATSAAEMPATALDGLRRRIVETTNRRVFTEGMGRRKTATEIERELLPANLPTQDVFRNFLIQLREESESDSNPLLHGMHSCFTEYTPVARGGSVDMTPERIQTAAPETLASLIDTCMKKLGAHVGRDATEAQIVAALEANKTQIASKMAETKTALAQLRGQSDFNRVGDYLSVLQGLHRHRCNTKENPALTAQSCSLSSLGLDVAGSDRQLQTFTNSAGEILAEISGRLSENSEARLGRDLAIMCHRSDTTLRASLATLCPLRNLVAGGDFTPPPEISRADQDIARANRDSMDGRHIDNDPIAGMVSSGRERESFWEMGAIALAGGVGSVATTYAGVMSYNNSLNSQIAAGQAYKQQMATYAAFQQQYPFGMPPGFFPFGSPFFNGFGTGFYIPPSSGLAGSASYSAYLSFR